LGEVRMAVDALRHSVAAGLEDYEWMKRDPDLESIRGDKEFVALLEGK